MQIIVQHKTQWQTKGPVGRSLRENKQGDHSRLQFKGGDAIEVYSGDNCGFKGCKHAFQVGNSCRLALCYACYEILMKEHGVTSFESDRHYKFPGCSNHSYKDLVEEYDCEGAHWCKKDKKENTEDDPRPHGCVHCLRPFLFCGKKSKKQKTRK